MWFKNLIVEQFDANLAIMAGEMEKLLPQLISVFGGEGA